MKKLLCVSIVGLMFCWAEPTSATVITFETVPVGLIAGDSITINAGGVNVTFTGAGLRIRQFSTPYPNTRVLSTLFDKNPITATFGSGYTADYVEIENIINGRFIAETDVIGGTAYNANNLVLDTKTNSNTIHHLGGPGIASIVYDDIPDGQGYVLDNFTFVPEPSSLALVGLMGLFVGRRRVRYRFWTSNGDAASSM